MGEPFDIITVPDFSGNAREVFEDRSLLFLASWMENAGKARSLPLHLACIGEPPQTVRRLANRAGAHLSLHEPVQLASAHTANKLRGLEIEPQTERHLLVDTDIVFLGDISTLGATSEGIAAAPGGGAKVPLALWNRLYAEMGLEVPEGREPLLRAELDMPPPKHEAFPGQASEVAASFPYFNSGVVLASWHDDLRRHWQDFLERGAALVREDEPGSAGVLRSDQAGFALMVASFKAKGIPFHRLPETMHVRWGHLYRGKPLPAEMRILHTTGMGMGADSNERLAAGSPRPLHRWCNRVEGKLSSLFDQDLPFRPEVAARRRDRGRLLLGEVRDRLVEIFHHQIEGKV